MGRCTCGVRLHKKLVNCAFEGVLYFCFHCGGGGGVMWVML